MRYHLTYWLCPKHGEGSDELMLISTPSGNYCRKCFEEWQVSRYIKNIEEHSTKVTQVMVLERKA